MSLRKKTIVAFLISAITISILIIFAYANFIEIKKEIHFLKLSATLTNLSLQLRRHEKNFFLYQDSEEVKEVHSYVAELKKTLKDFQASATHDPLVNLRELTDQYEAKFNRIESAALDFRNEFSSLKTLHSNQTDFFKLIESTFLENPLINAEILKKVFKLRPESPAIRSLQQLQTEISSLRKTGEELLIVSKALDKSASENAERYIDFLQTAALFLFPSFLLIGVGTSFAVSHNIVRHLKLLTGAMERTGKGDFKALALPEKTDEVGVLIKAFNKMEMDLIERDKQLKKKNEELLRSRKLVSIGTLASGIAHELNNPLNNIYLATQTLSRNVDQKKGPAIIEESFKDIFSQTFRMKRIVSDLLEFSRQRAPELEMINIASTIENLLHWMKTYGEMADVQYSVTADEEIKVPADKGLLQQVFINLCGNAIDAMDGKGTLRITVKRVETRVQIRVSDTGKGISSSDMVRIFDPFFTTKEKGTGLGLAIVYSIIERHNGYIEVESTPGKGTTFTITMPGK